MDAHFSDRIQDVPRSFIREILKVTMNNEMISFAGGLPNRQFFPLRQLQQAAGQWYPPFFCMISPLSTYA